MKRDRLWFRRKTYGWGWTPSSWEGWVVTLAAVIAIFLAAWRINPDERPYEFAAALIIIVGLLFIIGYRKGERPKWSWGK